MRKLIIIFLLFYSVSWGQDLRQSYPNLTNTRATLYITTNDTTSITAANTYYTINGFSGSKNNNITLTDSSMTMTQGGIYWIAISYSLTGTANTVFHVCLFTNGTENTEIESEREIGAAGTIGAAAISGMVILSADDVLKLKVKADGTSKAIILVHLNFSVVRIQ